MKVLVLIHSLYGHIGTLAEAIVEGVREVSDAEVLIKRIPETIPASLLKNISAGHARQQLAGIPVADPNELGNYDAIIFGSATCLARCALC